MKNKKLSIVFMFLFTALVLLFTSGCDTLQGPAGANGIDGADGADGLPGPVVYLEDGSGNRYYSGGSIYLGATTESITSVETNLKLVNASTSTLTLTETPFLNLGSFEFVSIDGTSYSTYYDSDSEFGYISINQSGLSDTIDPEGESPDFSFIIETVSNPSFRFDFQREYTIAMEQEGDNFNFVVKVYGFVSSSSSSGDYW